MTTQELDNCSTARADGSPVVVTTTDGYLVLDASGVWPCASQSLASALAELLAGQEGCERLTDSCLTVWDD